MVWGAWILKGFSEFGRIQSTMKLKSVEKKKLYAGDKAERVEFGVLVFN